MSKHHPRPSLKDIRNTHFDFLHPIKLPAAAEPDTESRLGTAGTRLGCTHCVSGTSALQPERNPGRTERPAGGPSA